MTDLEKAYAEVKEQCDYIRSVAEKRPMSKSAAVVKSFDLALDALQDRISSQNPKPLTQSDVETMHFEKVWISFHDGDDNGEWGIVIFGRLYSIETLEGAGFEDILSDLMDGETLNRPSGEYSIYRTKPSKSDIAK